ncbi:hypothetical protein [Collinsella aerofaciens]|uniref:hypothetical protein n=1 Tax=Collinsella aerofaciens TaxID=74426 RepID=UPI0034A56784
MDEIVCANTAFRYWRCPPQVRDLYPRLPSPEDGWRALAQSPFVTDVLKTPIITTTVPGGVNYHSGLRTTIHCDDASGVDSALETTMSFRVTNPLATLFTMARFVSPTDLVLAMYEFCGWFSVFEPTAAAEAELDKGKDAAENASTESLFELDESQDEAQWKRVYARVKVKEQVKAKGAYGKKKTKEVTKLKGTSLWMRKPLIELHELHEYARKMKSRKWGTKFFNAAQIVTGIAASPLEVAGILLLSLPRSRGGSGFRNVFVNDFTPLTASAKSIAGQKVCYEDIVIVNPTIMKAGILEIQGEVIHGSGAVLDHDVKRMTALQSMGYDVFLVTHDMLNDAELLDAIVRSLCSRLELRYRCKTKIQRTRETELRANVLCNWLEIGR